MLGDDAELAVAAQLAGVDQADAAADALARIGVLEDARPPRFVHAIVRDAVATRLSAGVRDTLHARAAEILAARHAARDAVAVHLLATEPRGRTWVVDQLAAAARLAIAQGAPEAAVGGSSERSRSRLPHSCRPSWCSTSRGPRASSGGEHAVAHFRRAHELATDPAVRARAALELTWAGGPALDTRSVVALLERAVADVGRDSELALELEAARLAAIHTSAPLLAESWAAGELQRWARLEGRTPGRAPAARAARAGPDAGRRPRGPVCRARPACRRRRRLRGGDGWRHVADVRDHRPLQGRPAGRGRPRARARAAHRAPARVARHVRARLHVPRRGRHPSRRARRGRGGAACGARRAAPERLAASAADGGAARRADRDRPAGRSPGHARRRRLGRATCATIVRPMCCSRAARGCATRRAIIDAR